MFWQAQVQADSACKILTIKALDGAWLVTWPVDDLDLLLNLPFQSLEKPFLTLSSFGVAIVHKPLKFENSEHRINDSKMEPHHPSEWTRRLAVDTMGQEELRFWAKAKNRTQIPAWDSAESSE